MQSPSGLFDTDLGVGEILRRTRVHYGQSIADIEKALRIRASQIKAIEEEDVENLPGRVYAIGFVRSYAEYLGLDGDKMVHLFKAQSGGKASSPELEFPVHAADSKMPPLWLVFLSSCAAILIIAGWWAINGQDRTLVTEISDVPAHLKVGSLSISQEEGLTTAAPGQDILLNIIESSWVEIKDADGNVLVERVLQPGEQYFVPDGKSLSLSVANAGGVQLSLGDDIFHSLGKSGEAKSDIPLDLTQLKAYFPSGDQTPDKQQ